MPTVSAIAEELEEELKRAAQAADERPEDRIETYRRLIEETRDRSIREMREIVDKYLAMPPEIPMPSPEPVDVPPVDIQAKIDAIKSSMQ